MDLNKDGVVDKAELMQALDTNKDGAIDRAEFQAAAAKIAPAKEPGPAESAADAPSAQVEAIEALLIFKRKSELKRKMMKASNRVSWVGKAEARMKKLRAKISGSGSVGRIRRGWEDADRVVGAAGDQG